MNCLPGLVTRGGLGVWIEKYLGFRLEISETLMEPGTLELFAEIFQIGYRLLADETFTDIGGRFSIH